MTAAAGFVYKDGIVICADTLMSGGTVSRHASKIGGYRFKDGVALFAVAGNTAMAAAAIQQCEIKLTGFSGKSRTQAEIANQIRNTLGVEYKRHVIENRYEDTANDYAIIVAVFSKTDGLGLYSTSRSTMGRSKTGYEFIGSGEPLAFLAAQRMNAFSVLNLVDARHIHVLAAYAMGEAKRHQKDAVGGDSVIIHIQRDGKVSSAHGCNEPLVEKYATEFHEYTDGLLSVFLDLDRETAFKEYISSLSDDIREMRKRYREEVGSSFYLGPTETSKVMWEINRVA